MHGQPLESDRSRSNPEQGSLLPGSEHLPALITLFPCSGNVERSESLHDNTLTLMVPLMHEVDSSITG